MAMQIESDDPLVFFQTNARLDISEMECTVLLAKLDFIKTKWSNLHATDAPLTHQQLEMELKMFLIAPVSFPFYVDPLDQILKNV